MTKNTLFLTSILIAVAITALAEIKTGDRAPAFQVKTHEGASFSLADRKGQWTVLYFYPKADTPGCTKQACAFRDSIKKVRDVGAEVFGISVNTVAEQAAFHKKHHLNFALLADEKAQVAKAYGAKMPVVNIAKRWTFIIDPDLNIRHIEQNVDPVKDADKTATRIAELQKVK